MFKQYAQYFILAVVLLFVQTHPLLPFGKHGLRPDLLLIMVVYTGLTFSPGRGAFACFFLGYFIESLSGSHSGLYITIYLLVFMIIKLLKRFFDFDSLFEVFLLLLICLAGKFFILLFFLHFIYEYEYVFIKVPFLKELLFTLVFFPFVFPLLQHFGKNQKLVNQPYAKLNHVHRI